MLSLAGEHLHGGVCIFDFIHYSGGTANTPQLGFLPIQSDVTYSKVTVGDPVDLLILRLLRSGEFDQHTAD